MDANGNRLATTYSDSTGHYLFDRLSAGDYQVNFQVNRYSEIQDGMVYGAVDTYAGNNTTLDSDGIQDGYGNVLTAVFHLDAGQNRRDIDLGLYGMVGECPIALDLDGNGIQTTSVHDSTGKFDLLENGSPIHSGWLSKGDGFLAVDTNGNGKIDSRAELFGGANIGDGFAKLASYDTNHDGAVDVKDAAFSTLLVWQDINGDHESSADELRSLADAGIASLKVQNTWDGTEQNGNILGETSTATRSDGSAIAMVDVYFGVGTIGRSAVLEAPAGSAETTALTSLLQPSDELLHKAMLPSEATAAPAAAAPDATDGGETLRQLLAAWNAHASATQVASAH